MGLIKYIISPIISFVFLITLCWMACLQPFLLKKVWVIGRTRTAISDILTQGNLKPDISLWDIHPDALSQRLSHIGWISSVSVNRWFPNSIVIDIHEKIPAFIEINDNRYTLLSQDGQIIKNFSQFRNIPHTFIGLPIIHGNTTYIQDVFNFYKILPHILFSHIQYSVLFSDGINIILTNGLVLELPLCDTAQQMLKNFLQKITPQTLLKQSWKMVDLRHRSAWLITL